MKLDESQLADYHRDGFLLGHTAFTPAELAVIRAEVAAELAAEGPRVVREAGGRSVRGVHGSHLTSAFFAELVRLPRLLEPARQLLGSDVYVHQFKINAKAACDGERWEWHQDLAFWRREDGMPGPAAINIAVHLDEATEFNGPLLLIPRSHRHGELAADETRPDQAAGLDASGPRQPADGWRRTVSAELKYTLRPEVLRDLIDADGITAAKGPPGTVLLFDPRLVHGSSGNITPYDRCLMIISYNSTENRLRHVPRPRPEFIAARRVAALRPLASDDLPAPTVAR